MFACDWGFAVVINACVYLRPIGFFAVVINACVCLRAIGLLR